MRPWFALAVALTLGCGATKQPAEAAPTDATPSPRTGTAQQDQAPYALRVLAPNAASTDREAIVKVVIEPHSPWHMNLEFPTAFELAAPDGVTLVAKKQKGGDAERLDDEGLVFAVLFTPHTAGKKHFSGEIRFAVCGEAECAPFTLPVEFDVPVT